MTDNFGLRPLLPYQHAPDLWAAGRKKALLRLDKRLGKTILAIRWAVRHFQQGAGSRWLIITPLSAAADWCLELERDRQLYDASRLADPRQFDKQIFFIVNPEALFHAAGKVECPVCLGSGTVCIGAVELYEYDEPCERCRGTGKIKGEARLSEIAMLEWDGVVWDETPKLRNPKSQINQVAHAAFFNVNYRLGLTGEIAPEHPTNIFEQVRWVYGSYMGHTNFYRWRHELFAESGYDWLPKPGAMGRIRRALDIVSFGMTRAEAGIKCPRVFERRTCELPPQVRKVYDHIEQHFELPDGYASNAPVAARTGYAVVVRNWLSQICGGVPKGWPNLTSTHKSDLLLDLLLGEFHNQQTVIIFQYNAELLGIANLLIGRNLKINTMMGLDKPPARRAKMDAFRVSKFQHFLLQAKVGTFGLDLSCANVMIRYSLPPDWETISQGMDRLVHPRKTEPNLYIDMIVKDSVDEDKAELLGDKEVDARFWMKRYRSNFRNRLMAKYGGAHATA